jgi:NAD dependent epimerase/dehydratase
LFSLGADVTALVHYNALGSWGNLKYLSPEAQKGIKVVAGTIDDGDYVASVLEGKDVVFHLAALIAIPFSYLAPRSYVRTNVEGTLNVLEAVRRGATGLAIHTSTSEVYGTAIRSPIDEDHPLQGQSPYSATKIAADKLAESYWRSFETKVITVRPFNTYGPRQSARAVIPTIISQALEQPGIRLGALDPQRDMTYVGDTVDGFLAAAARPELAGETINLGTGFTESVGDIVNRIQRLMGTKKSVTEDARRIRPAKSEVMKLISDNSKALRLMGWAPKTDLDEGLRHTIQFVSANAGAYRSSDYNV